MKLPTPGIAAPLLALTLVACGNHSPGGMTGPSLNHLSQKPERHHLETSEVFERPRATSKAVVKHILLGYSGRSGAYRTKMDPRGAERSRADAEELVVSLKAKLDDGAVFEALMMEHSEDGPSAKTAKAYSVDSESNFDPDFIRLSLRLEVGEIGVVHSQFGFHLIKRVS